METLGPPPAMAMSVAQASSEGMLMRDLVPRTPTMTSSWWPRAEIPSLAQVKQMLLAGKAAVTLRNEDAEQRHAGLVVFERVGEAAAN